MMISISIPFNIPGPLFLVRHSVQRRMQRLQERATDAADGGGLNLQTRRRLLWGNHSRLPSWVSRVMSERLWSVSFPIIHRAIITGRNIGNRVFLPLATEGRSADRWICQTTHAHGHGGQLHRGSTIGPAGGGDLRPLEASEGGRAQDKGIEIARLQVQSALYPSAPPPPTPHNLQCGAFRPQRSMTDGS